MRAFDSDWNETMCRIRLKTMCGEWRLGHVLDFTHMQALSTVVLLFGQLLFFLFCFCSVMGHNNLYKSQWLNQSSTFLVSWHWWKGPDLPRTSKQKFFVYAARKVWKSAGFRFDSVVLLWRKSAWGFLLGRKVKWRERKALIVIYKQVVRAGQVKKQRK